MPALCDGDEAVLNPVLAGGDQAFPVEPRGAGDAIEHLRAIVCHLGLDAQIRAGKPLPGGRCT